MVCSQTHQTPVEKQVRVKHPQVVGKQLRSTKTPKLESSTRFQTWCGLWIQKTPKTILLQNANCANCAACCVRGVRLQICHEPCEMWALAGINAWLKEHSWRPATNNKVICTIQFEIYFLVQNVYSIHGFLRKYSCCLQAMHSVAHIRKPTCSEVEQPATNNKYICTIQFRM